MLLLDPVTKPRERPILFQGAMVRAILAGTKTQTRRVVKGTALEWLRPDGFTPEFVANPENHLCPYGYPGDRLWVREAFSGQSDYDTGHDGKPWPPSAWFKTDPIWYWADGDPPHGDWTRPRPSIHMPRWACRITQDITATRVERLQEISEEDAIAEGVVQQPGGWWSAAEGQSATTARAAYALLWNSINGDPVIERDDEGREIGRHWVNWDANPWVWVVEFKRTEGAIRSLSSQAGKEKGE